MSPPGLMAKPRMGVTTSPGTQDLARAARLILDNCGIAFGQNRLMRLVLTFKERAPYADGHIFFQYLANAVQLTAEQQRVALLNPDIVRVISYADPTGESAVNNVLRDAR